MEVVCKHCNRNDGFYREVEVTGTGWANAEVAAQKDRSILGTIDDNIQDIQWDRSSAYEMNWGCAACGVEKAKLEDLVEIKEPEEIDPIAQAQKNPIKGQEALDV